MPYYKDLREYLDVLEKAGKLRAITAPINKDTELHPLVKWQYRGLAEEKRFGFLFENLLNRKGVRYAGRAASSVIAPNREVYALALNCRADEIQQRWIQALENPTQTKVLSHGPCKEEIHKGGELLEHGGLEEFPIPVATNGFEAFPRITAGTWISRDPDTGAYNTGLYNGIILGPDRVACRVVSPGQGGLIHWRKWRQRGQATPVALVIGGPPVVPIVAATRVPHDTSELEVAGALMGEPLEVVRCETLDIHVPATAEIVVEGEWLSDYLEHDGPSGENWGHTVLGNFVPSFRVKCITHRKNPIWLDIICQIPPSESSTLRGIGSEGRILALLRSHGIPQVTDVALHHCGGGARFCVLQFHDLGGYRTPNSVVWQALFATLSVSPGWPKIAIAVDEDIDARSLESVFWAVCGRIQPHRDVRIIQGRNPSLDQSAAPRIVEKKEEDFLYAVSGSQAASAILIDATRKWEYTPISLPKRPYMERAKKLWEELNLPPLQPISPWYGVSLGLWPEEVSKLVELFEQGRGDEAAQELIKKGKRI